jgi:hypothetical protein
MTLEANYLTEVQLKKYGAKVTKDRHIIKERALAAVQDRCGITADEYLQTTEKLARKMHQHTPKFEKKHNQCIEPHQTKTVLSKSFDLSSKFSMLHDLVIGKYSQQDAAKKYGRSQSFVS